MRKAVLVALTLLFLGFAVPAQKIQKASDILKAAETKAAEQNKSIILIFGASWCEACHQLDTFLGLREISPIIDQHFVVAHVSFGEAVAGHPDWDTPGSDFLIARYGGIGSNGRVSLPFIAVVDAKAKLLANSEFTTKNDKESTGFPAEPAEINAFLSMLQKGAPTLTPDDLHKIEAGLRQASAE
jgi:hypothetical protein